MNAGLHTDFISSSCDAITAGPIDEGGASIPILNWFINDRDVEVIREMACDLLTGAISEFFGADFTQPITSDYMVGATKLGDLNAYSHPNIQKVAFYGVEEDPVFFRVANFFLEGDPNTADVFQADDDEELFDDVDHNRQQYYNKYVAWAVEADNRCGVIPQPGCSTAESLRDKWYEGYEWWESEGNDAFKIFVGATEIPSGFECECTEYQNGVPVRTYTVPTQPNGECNSFPDPNTFCEKVGFTRPPVEHPSDGVVLEASAKAFPGVPFNRKVLMEDSNHQQMRNDSNTEMGFNDLFEGNLGGYFFTPKK
ncbi:MAG: hypothetical protein AAGI23_09725 [Bacteroidota bacterium]